MRNLILILTILLLAASERERRQTLLSTQSPQPRPQAQTYLQWIRASKTYRCLIRIGEGALLLAAMGQAVATFWGPFWPLDPEIHPQNAPEASFIMPFTIKNTSVFVDIVDAEMSCGVDLLIAEDALHNRLLARDMAFITGNLSIAAGRKPVGYICDASKLIEIKPDGTISLRGSLNTLPGEFKAPLHVVKACVWIRGTYKIFWIVPWSFVSIIFQWPVILGSAQWNEGPVIRNPQDIPISELWPPSAAWAMRWLYIEGYPRMLRPESIECDVGRHLPYALFRGPGAPELILK